MSQIKVTITDNTGNAENVTSSGIEGTQNTAVSNKGKIKSSDVGKADKSSKSLAIASMVASQTFNYATSNIGKWTGSTQKQTAVNNVTQLANIGSMAFISPMMAVANVGMNLATTAMDTAYEQKWDRISKENARARAGELKGRGR